MLKNAKVIDEAEISTDTVSLGCTVTVYDVEFDEEIEYSIGCIGGWMIEASAVIDGEQYTAFTLTKLRTDWRGIELPEGYLPPAK